MITYDTSKPQRIIKRYPNDIFSKKLGSLEEMFSFHDLHDPLKLNLLDIINLSHL